MRDDRREIEALEPDWAVGALAQEIAAANQLVDRVDPDLSHQFAQVLGDKEEVADDLVGGATEAFAQDGVLRGDADGAGVEMADAHHDAARGDEWCRREAKFFGPEQRPDHHVATCAEATIDLQRHLCA